MPRLLTLFLLFFLPLVVLQFGTSHFETPKVIIAELSIELLVPLFLFRKHNLQHFLAHHAPIVALFLLSLVHLILYPSAGFSVINSGCREYFYCGICCCGVWLLGAQIRICIGTGGNI